MAPKDLDLVVRNVPRDILAQLMTHPGELFLAGGAIRDIIRGEAPNDYDLFGNDLGMLSAIALKFSTLPNTEVLQSENALTLAPNGRIPIQLITKWRYDSPEQLANEFDFTVAKTILFCDPLTRNWIGLVDPDFYSDLVAKRLVYIGGGTPGGTLLRMIKLLRRGFSIQVDSLATLISRVMQEAELKRAHTDDGQEFLLRQVLREVDPLPVVVQERAA